MSVLFYVFVNNINVVLVVFFLLLNIPYFKAHYPPDTRCWKLLFSFQRKLKPKFVRCEEPLITSPM